MLVAFKIKLPVVNLVLFLNISPKINKELNIIISNKENNFPKPIIIIKYNSMASFIYTGLKIYKYNKLPNNTIKKSYDIFNNIIT